MMKIIVFFRLLIGGLTQTQHKDIHNIRINEY